MATKRRSDEATKTAEAPTVLTARKGRSPLLPYQVDWVNDESPSKLGDKSRRTGWTYCEAFDAVSRRFRKTNPRDMDYWFSSADESAAMEFIDYCRYWAKDLFGKVADVFTESIEDSETKRAATAYCLRTPGERKIVGMTSNPRRFRSKGGDVCLDEIAHHDNAKAMYDAASPVTTWGGWMRAFSTPLGESSLFAKMVKAARKVIAHLGGDPDQPRKIKFTWQQIVLAAAMLHATPVMSYHRVTIVDAIEQGIVEKINETRGTTWTREEFLADCRAKCVDEAAFRQEYMCEPSADAVAWLTYSLIESCEHDDCPQIDAPLTGYTGGPVYVGIDVGRVHDLTAAWFGELVGDVLWVRRILTLRNVPMPEQFEQLSAAMREVRVVRAHGDQTGIGLGLCEFLAKRFAVTGISFTGPAKEALAVRLKQRVEDRGIRYAAHSAALRDDLHGVRKIVTPSGAVRFDGERDAAGHKDHFWAAALMVDALGGANEVKLWVA